MKHNPVFTLLRQLKERGMTLNCFLMAELLLNGYPSPGKRKIPRLDHMGPWQRREPTLIMIASVHNNGKLLAQLLLVSGAIINQRTSPVCDHDDCNIHEQSQVESATTLNYTCKYCTSRPRQWTKDMPEQNVRKLR